MVFGGIGCIYHCLPRHASQVVHHHLDQDGQLQENRILSSKIIHQQIEPLSSASVHMPTGYRQPPQPHQAAPIHAWTARVSLYGVGLQWLSFQQRNFESYRFDGFNLFARASPSGRPRGPLLVEETHGGAAGSTRTAYVW